MTKEFFYGPPPTRYGADYYAVIAWDSPKGGDHRRLWESPTIFDNPTDALAAINEELGRKSYPDTGLKTYVLEHSGKGRG